MRRFVSLWALTLAMGASAALAQTITDGNALFRLNTSATQGSADLRPEGGTTTDHLFRNWWWYRVNGVNSSEVIFPWNSAGANGAVGPANTLTVPFTGLGSGSFDAVLQYVLTDSATPGQASLVESMTVTNRGTTPLSLSLFNYADFDVGGTAGSDIATLTGPTDVRMTIVDGVNFAEFLGVNANAYAVAAFGASPSLVTQLNDAAISNFGNTGLPFGPGDFTGVYQWDLLVGPGGSVTVFEGLAANMTAVPEPATLGLIALGALALIRRR